ASQYLYLGVGVVDVTVEFVVTDEETGRPIKGAVLTGLGRLDAAGDDEREFRLETNDDGVAEVVVRNVMCTMTTNAWGTTTYGVYPVRVMVMVTASGYEEAGRNLHEDRPIHTGVRRACLIVPFALRKVGP